MTDTAIEAITAANAGAGPGAGRRGGVVSGRP